MSSYEKDPAVVGDPDDSEVPSVDYQWLINNASPPYRAYCQWYKENARLYHPAYALASAQLFFQACAGRNIKSPSGLRADLWPLILGSSAGGKRDIREMAGEGLRQLQAKKLYPAVPFFEDAFSSGQAMWGHAMHHPSTVWFNEELVEELTNMIRAEQGTQLEKRQTVLKLSSTAQSPYMPQPRYALSTQGRYSLQPLIYTYFAICGTGVPDDIKNFTNSAAKNGLLNRFEVEVVEGQPTIGNIGGLSALPEAIVKWAKKTFMKDESAAMKQNAESRVGNALLIETYPDFETDYRVEKQFELDMCEKNVGIYGRLVEKMIKRALIQAWTGPGSITPEIWAWARRSVRDRAEVFAKRFEDEGGGAKSPDDALCRAFMQAFNTRTLKQMHRDKGAVRMSDFDRYAGKPWKDCKDKTKRQKIIEYLASESAGYIIEADEKELYENGVKKGVWVRKLKDYV